MRYRYTMKMLKEYTDYELLQSLVYERRSDCTNIYAPMNQRLIKLQRKLERKETLTK